jgi:hypothetical protein
MLKQLAKYLQLVAQSVRLANLPEICGVRDDAVDLDTALKAGRCAGSIPDCVIGNVY